MWYRKLVGLVFLVLFVAIPGIVQAQAQPEANYLVQFSPQATLKERQDWMTRHCATELLWMPQISWAQVKFSGQCRLSMSILSADEGLVTKIEQDVVVQGTSLVTDPINTSSVSGYAWSQIEAQGAWNLTQGVTEVIIAVVDSGIDMSHTEFVGRILPGYDYINNDPDPSDDEGHGTAVAGVLGATADGIGLAGMCPRCSLLPIKVLGQGNYGTWGSVAKGIIAATDLGAGVINLSLGAYITTSTLISAVQYALDHDVVVVAAAGNEQTDKEFFPAALPGVIAVSGTDYKDQSWYFTNHGGFVDLAAPASGIVSAKKGGGYKAESGTSLASPFVAGTAALIRSHRPDLKAGEVLQVLEDSAKDLGDPGWDPYFGFGRLDAHKALVTANFGEDIQVPLYLVYLSKGG